MRFAVWLDGIVEQEADNSKEAIAKAKERLNKGEVKLSEVSCCWVCEVRE